MCDVTLFDLDGVLTKGNTMARLVARRLRRHPARWLVAVPLFVFAMTTAPDSALRARLNRRLVALALKGLNEPEYSLLASNLALELASTPRFLSTRAILECKPAAARTRTVVVTASERLLARAFLDALGLSNVELQASELRIRNRATAFVQHNVGPGKLARLRCEGVNPALAVLYTDSASDLPLATAVAQTILVNPRTPLPAQVPDCASGSESKKMALKRQRESSTEQREGNHDSQVNAPWRLRRGTLGRCRNSSK